MNVKELRIGNYVSNGNNEILVDCHTIYDNSVICTGLLKTIPLTEEWLVKFGFERTSYGREFKGFHLEASSRVLATDVLSGFSWEQVVDEKYLRILHVHQLQNLYFALTNEELTIK